MRETDSRDFEKLAITIFKKLSAKFINKLFTTVRLCYYIKHFPIIFFHKISRIHEVYASVEVGSVLTAEAESLGATAVVDDSTGDDDELPTTAADDPKKYTILLAKKNKNPAPELAKIFFPILGGNSDN